MISPEKLRIYSFGDIVADAQALEVRRDGTLLELEPKSLRVLFHLIENRERVVSKEELIQQVWAGAFVTDNALTRVIAQIRKQLADNARSPRFIQTSASAGYRFIAELDPPPTLEAVASQVQEPPPPLKSPKSRRRAFLTVAATSTMLVCAGLGWWAYRAAPDKPRQIIGLQQLTTSMALDRWPTFSPDGSLIAFTSERSGQYQIYTRSVAQGSADRQITFDNDENIQPTWSPHGDYIAYASVARGGINIIPASGGAIRNRTDFGDGPQWSPDGRWLVFRNTGQRVNPARDPIDVPDATLWLVEVNGGAPVALTTRGSPVGGHENPRWLSDSTHVVFEDAVLIPPTTPRPDFKVFIVDIGTRKLQSIAVGDLPARNPVFSPDLKHLYFDVRFGVQPGLWQVSIDSHFQAGQPAPIMPSNGPLLRDLAFNGTGTRLAFSSSNDESALWSVALDSSGSAAAEPKPLIREHVRLLLDPAFSPDGSKIAYTYNQRDSKWIKMSIYTANSDGSDPGPLTTAEEQSFGPSWVDQNQVGYEVVDNGVGSYWIRPMGGRARHTNLQFDWNRSNDVRLHGDRAVADVRNASGRQQIFEADLAGGAPKALTPDSRNIDAPCWSKDGKWIAAREIINGKSTLVIFPSQGGEIQTLVERFARTTVNDWSPDSNRIAFAGLDQGIWNIYWVDRRTKEVRQLTHFTTPAAAVSTPAWSPTGSQIVFQRYDQLANIHIADLR